MESDCAVVIVAAGSGSRMRDSGPPKQFRPLLGCPVFLWSARYFDRLEEVCEIVVVCPGDQCEQIGELCRTHGVGKLSRAVAGGARRQDSVSAGLRALAAHSRLVAIHDAARPFPPDNFGQALRLARDTGAALFASPVVDTLKRADNTRVVETVSRSGLWGAQTPQIFRRELLEHALAYCDSHQMEVSDDASAVEALGEHVHIVAGPRTNLKITTSDDWPLAEALAAALGRTP